MSFDPYSDADPLIQDMDLSDKDKNLLMQVIYNISTNFSDADEVKELIADLDRRIDRIEDKVDELSS